ncbi:MAG TPA: amylo-alpha-1,6-glucosidase [Steroidobacteraceae bacterium]|nr:amylo-alpha-1,6-glucosidase [Steroidobacteraceae bacterium]
MGGLTLDRGELRDFDAAASREWLVTNGLGGFAAGTVSGARTRRYHGLLVASLKPPVERVVTLAKLDVRACYARRNYALGSNEFGDGTVDPRGYELIESFRLDGSMPVWTFALGDALLEQRIWMAHGSNTTYVRFELRRASGPLALELSPLCTWRDYHSQWRGGGDFAVTASGSGCSIRAHDHAALYRLAVDRGRFHALGTWYWDFRHRAESARGLDDREDLFLPGVFRLTLEPGESATFTVTTERDEPLPGSRALDAERARERALLGGVDADAPEWIRQLHLAADQFLVRRASSAVNDATRAPATARAHGTTVIAGYPWFGDWGRDTMIALPGLTLTTRRFAEAAAILRTFAGHVSQGMLPNRFPDAGEPPEYNTVDATLWYFHAIHAHALASGERALGHELYPVLKEIVDWHRRGTRYSIHVDERDGLLYAGEPGVQLTWMDAKLGDWVVTARIGKPVEINALWFNALAVMADLAREVGDRAAARDYSQAAERTRSSLARLFVHHDGGHLCDVIDTPDGERNAHGYRVDPSLRPNQIFAVSLPHAALRGAEARAVVDACARELWTPVGLRSLASSDPAYAGRYAGDSRHRDGSYHQGTVWSWLLGPFARAHLNAYGDPLLALSYLEGVAGHVADAGVGSISEVFDGNAPHAPEGCFAQAWSVAEILSAWTELSAVARSSQTRLRRAKT